MAVNVLGAPSVVGGTRAGLFPSAKSLQFHQHLVKSSSLLLVSLFLCLLFWNLLVQMKFNYRKDSSIFLASLYSSCVHPLSWFLGIGHRSWIFTFSHITWFSKHPCEPKIDSFRSLIYFLENFVGYACLSNCNGCEFEWCLHGWKPKFCS